MKILIAGATGVLGRRLVAGFSRRGHDVVGLARSDAKADLVRDLGGDPARADLFDAGTLVRVAEGAELVVHAATAIPVGFGARRREAWTTNDRIRTEGTRALAAAAGAVGARRLLQQSVVWVVKDRGAPRYDETTTPDPPVLIRSAVEGEVIAREAGARHGFEVGVLRAGTFYGEDTAHSRTIAKLLRRRRLPVLGRGDNLLAPIHADDAARAFIAAAEAETADGIWHVVDDEPVTAAHYFERLARLLDAPTPRRAPLWLGRLLLGRHVVESLTTPMNTSNERARRELRWEPDFPSIREGFARMVERWRREGLVPRERAPSRSSEPRPPRPTAGRHPG
ncbi:MAG: NAD-dependent epimerase/dehydratase family protein [Gemmatimonadota bacterium]